jgi:adsorption protein B
MLLDALDLAARALGYPVAVMILLNQLDELFVDLNFLGRGLYRRRPRVLPEAALAAAPVRRIAILLPAWQEADVIAQMLERNLAAVDYPHARYAIFCGTYRNDPDTQVRVDEVAARHPSVHKVVVPHDGPTSKADCLNWIYRAMREQEARQGLRHDILLLQDAEDVIHPKALRLASLLVPRYELVQTPVLSLPRSGGAWVAGTYIDEFAESHLKELVVREALGGPVPSAGVGTAFDRAAFDAIARGRGDEPFDPESLTEDYEIGLRFKLAGRRVHFAWHAMEDARADGHEDVIATREYFPDRLGASIRQRSRWVLGIALQGWARGGWTGPAAVRYCLWRDRKGLLMSQLVVVAYALFAWGAGRAAWAPFSGSGWTIDRIVPQGSLLAGLLAANTVTLAWRMAFKAACVGRLYGWVQAVLTVPRMVVGTVIGVAATARAVRTWVRHRLTGEPLRWVKTAHVFPVAEGETEPTPRLTGSA